MHLIVPFIPVELGTKWKYYSFPKNSIARFKLDAREYIPARANTYSLSSQQMLTSKGSMLSSRGNMLLCMILLATEVDAYVQLLARIRHRAVSKCTRARLHALMHYFKFKLDACEHYSSNIH